VASSGGCRARGARTERRAAAAIADTQERIGALGLKSSGRDLVVDLDRILAALGDGGNTG
jgi:hypothetical protein